MKDWGIKVSKQGKDVMYLDSYGNNPDLVFSSKYDIMKIAKTGSGSFSTGSSATIAHGLGYPGAYIVYLSTDNTNFYTYHGQIGGTSYIDSTNLVIAKDRDTTTNYYYPIDDNDYGTKSDSTYYAGYTKVGHDDGFGGNWKGAFRFRNVAETSSGITSVSLGFYIESRSGGTVQVRTKAFAVDDIADFGGDPWGNSLTSAEVTNSCDGGITAGGTWEYGVTNVFNEIVGRSGWSSGNDMGFSLENNGTTGTNYIIDNSTSSDDNSYLKVVKQAAAQTIYYRYVIFTNKLDSTKTL